MNVPETAEGRRIAENTARTAHWNRWGPYLSARAWGTVREDYSPNGTAWDYFPHDHARSRAYRWSEDGILGISDRHQRICFALALWNGKDPILKERFFGLTNSEGNHGVLYPGLAQRMTFANSVYVRAYSCAVLKPTCQGPSTSLPIPQ